MNLLADLALGEGDASGRHHARRSQLRCEQRPEDLGPQGPQHAVLSQCDGGAVGKVRRGNHQVREFPGGPASCQGDLGIKVTIKATSRCPSGLTSHA
jgi:hypothetical protein